MSFVWNDSIRPHFFPGQSAHLIESNKLHLWDHTVSAVVHEVRIKLGKNGTVSREYFFDPASRYHGPHREEDLFDTEADARAGADVRNKAALEK
jgi:hypothetical protein